MTEIFPNLFQPGMIAGLEIKNRVVRAPLHSGHGAPDGSVTSRQLEFYRELARGGCGLVVVEYTCIDTAESKASANQLSIASDEYIDGLSRLARTIQENGARAALQIVHAGSARRFGKTKAPSPVPPNEGGAVPEELNAEEIREIITVFGDAARRAMLAGFDMVELHGAHGYLITNFLSPKTNRRTDRYGGSLEGRMRFLIEVVGDVRTKVGANYPLGVRLSAAEYEPGGITIEETIRVVRALEGAGVSVIHSSGGNDFGGLVHLLTPMCFPLAHNAWAAAAIKKEVKIPVIASGGITTPELAENIIGSGQGDFVSLGRPLIADPDWPQKAKEGKPEDIMPCIRCNDGCVYRGSRQSSAVRCTVNAAVGEDTGPGITPAGQVKKIAVIGGGPAGMEAARVATLRGHEVTLYEKRVLGGVLQEASFPDFKHDLKRLIDYLTTQIMKLKVRVILEDATVATIKDGGFDAAIVAVGGNLRRLNVPGIEKPIVSSGLEVLEGRLPEGRRVVIVGGGIAGSEVGLYLAEQGKEIIFVELLDEFMKDVGFIDKAAYEEKLAGHRVTIYTGRQVEQVFNGGVTIVGKNGERDEIPADSVVVAIGFIPQTTLAEHLKTAGLEVYAIGDCTGPRRIFDAIHEGYLAAREL